MYLAKWTHIALTLCAALMILVVHLKRTGTETPSGGIAMVPLAEITAGPAPVFSINDPSPQPVITAARPFRAARPALRPAGVLTPPEPAPALVSAGRAGSKVPEPDVMTSQPADAPVLPQPVLASDENTRPLERAVDHRLESAVAAAVKKTAPHMESRSASGEEVHRQVVALIKRYIEEQHGREARPVDLASASRMAPLGMPARVVTSPRTGRWVLGASAGRQSLAGSALCSELYWGRRLSSGLQIGFNLSTSLVKGVSGESGGGTTLLQGDLQMRLFLQPRAKLAPFVLLGAGYGEYREEESSSAAPVAIAGAGLEYRFSRRLGAQVTASYEKMQVKKQLPESGGSGRGVWELKAGLVLAIGGPRMIAGPVSSGLAAAEFSAEQAEHLPR